MAITPRIADVRCTRLVFQPGDRILVRSMHRLEPDQKKKLRRSIEKWAGCAVEVLIVCLQDFDIEIEKRNGIQIG
jgi:hypothetical protein